MHNGTVAELQRTEKNHNDVGELRHECLFVVVRCRSPSKTVTVGPMFYGMKVIIPTVMRKQMMNRTHSSHLGAAACVRITRDVLFWPGMSSEITVVVTACSIYNNYKARQQKEPLMTHKIPKTTWTLVGQDLFSYRGDDYLVTVYFYSDYFELDHLSDTTTANNRRSGAWRFNDLLLGKSSGLYETLEIPGWLFRNLM